MSTKPKKRRTKAEVEAEQNSTLLKVRDALDRAVVLEGWIKASPNLEGFERIPMEKTAKEIVSLLSNSIPPDFFST